MKWRRGLRPWDTPRLACLHQASHWRQLADELQMERFGPFGSANVMTGEAGEKGFGRAGLAD